jgi:hypothetical protein
MGCSLLFPLPKTKQTSTYQMQFDEQFIKKEVIFSTLSISTPLVPLNLVGLVLLCACAAEVDAAYK